MVMIYLISINIALWLLLIVRAIVLKNKINRNFFKLFWMIMLSIVFWSGYIIVNAEFVLPDYYKMIFPYENVQTIRIVNNSEYKQDYLFLSRKPNYETWNFAFPLFSGLNVSALQSLDPNEQRELNFRTGLNYAEYLLIARRTGNDYETDLLRAQAIKVPDIKRRFYYKDFDNVSKVDKYFPKLMPLIELILMHFNAFLIVVFYAMRTKFKLWKRIFAYLLLLAMSAFSVYFLYEMTLLLYYFI